MRKGEICEVIIPPYFAYGPDGKPPSVPPKATLTYELELMDYKDPEPTNYLLYAGVIVPALIGIAYAVGLYDLRF
jgi:hypothetical protein